MSFALILAICATLFLCLGGVSLCRGLWQYRRPILSMFRAVKHHKKPAVVSTEESVPWKPLEVLTAARQWRIKRYLRANPTLALTVLRQDTQLAATAVRTMFAIDAAGDAPPRRETFSYPALSMFGGLRPLQRTLPKLTPAALRRFGEYPPARRAL